MAPNDIEAPWRDRDAAIIPNGGASGRKSYEVFTYGEQIASRPTLAEAQAVVEEVYGPLTWRQEKLPKAWVVHYYFGLTDEFGIPMMWVVDHLPNLG